MLREQLIKKEIGSGAFRWRSHEISRIKGLSDAVFGFAITLLVVSLEVPKTFNELLEAMRGFGAFAICFTLLFTVWYNQYKFFRRYGLRDTVTVVLNGALLFVVLFYVYPLKFLFSSLVERLTGGPGQVLLPGGHIEAVIEPGQVGTLMLIFGVGYFAVFGVFVLLYLRAYRKRKEARPEQSGTVRYPEQCSGIRSSLQHRDSFYRHGVGWRPGVGRHCRTDLYANRRGHGSARKGGSERRKRIEKSLPPAGELEPV